MPNSSQWPSQLYHLLSLTILMALEWLYGFLMECDVLLRKTSSSCSCGPVDYSSWCPLAIQCFSFFGSGLFMLQSRRFSHGQGTLSLHLFPPCSLQQSVLLMDWLAATCEGSSVCHCFSDCVWRPSNFTLNNKGCTKITFEYHRDRAILQSSCSISFQLVPFQNWHQEADCSRCLHLYHHNLHPSSWSDYLSWLCICWLERIIPGERRWMSTPWLQFNLLSYWTPQASWSISTTRE